MLSVCIPVYNVNVSKLVSALLEQVELLGEPCEIILIDDHSELRFADINKGLASDNVKYHFLAENIGRAKIRNLFLKYAQYEYLLFLDCDSEIVRNDFLAKYMEELKKGSKVVCGGRIYSDVVPPKSIRLHWKYGRTIESQPVSVRQMHPNASFMTNNFAIEKRVFQEVKLNELLEGYGHEDTLFGYDLKSRNIIVKHIDNPVLHAELNSNRVFMENTESALRNLVKVCEFMNYNAEFMNEVKLLRAYSSLKKKGMLFFIRISFAIKHPLARLMLVSGIANMLLFNYYKLGYFSRVIAKGK
jgi:glycosyltransferase involved in cell wall biosynthesis